MAFSLVGDVDDIFHVTYTPMDYHNILLSFDSNNHSLILLLSLSSHSTPFTIG